MDISAVSSRLLSDIDRFKVAIVPADYESLNEAESNSCAGIEVASTVLLRVLRATPDEGVWGYRVRGKSKSPPGLATNARQGWAAFVLDVFQPTGSARRFHFSEPAAREVEEGDCYCPD